jgi:hypothetical protein
MQNLQIFKSVQLYIKRTKRFYSFMITTTELPHISDKFYQIMLYPLHLVMSGSRTHNFTGDRQWFLVVRLNWSVVFVASISHTRMIKKKNAYTFLYYIISCLLFCIISVSVFFIFHKNLFIMLYIVIYYCWRMYYCNGGLWCLTTSF